MKGKINYTSLKPLKSHWSLINIIVLLCLYNLQLKSRFGKQGCKQRCWILWVSGEEFVSKNVRIVNSCNFIDQVQS